MFWFGESLALGENRVDAKIDFQILALSFDLSFVLFLSLLMSVIVLFSKDCPRTISETAGPNIQRWQKVCVCACVCHLQT